MLSVVEKLENIFELTDKQIKELTDEELLNLHRRLHQLYGAAKERGQATEYRGVNIHVWVVSEMHRRDMMHNVHDELDRETERLIKNAWLKERLTDAQDQVLVPAYINLVGSAVESESPNDIDVLIREDEERLSKGQKESLYLLMRKFFNDKKKLHLLFNASGPHLASNQKYVPLFDLVLRPRRETEYVAKVALKPIVQYQVSKPAMVGYTEFFSANELWQKWASKQGVQLFVSPKVDGFRTIIQKANDKISIYFEDAKEERAYELPTLTEALKGAPDLIIEGELVVAQGKNFLARPHVPSALKGKIKAEPYVFLYDLLYLAPQGDIHNQPFFKRYDLLKELGNKLGKHFIVLPQASATAEVAFKKAAEAMVNWQPWQNAELNTEGIVARRFDMPYNFGPTGDYAKFKLWVELKVKVLSVEKVQNGYVYNCALRDDGKDAELGKTFVSEERLASEGDTLNVMVEELLLYPDGKLAWGKPTPMGVDRSRVAYTVEQAVDIARRGRVLKEIKEIEKQEGEDGETRSEAAVRNWEENWYEAMPLSGKSLPFILHAHWRGLSKEETELSMEDLLKTNHSLHLDLRLGTDRFDGWWGITLFTKAYKENESIQSTPKMFGPSVWLKLGLNKPYVTAPGGVGATPHTYSKFFAIDYGTWQLGFARQHAVELILNGKLLKGRHLWQYAPAGESRIWLFTKPEDQRLYAAAHSFDKIADEIRSKRQRYLVWPKDPENLAKGHTLVDVTKIAKVVKIDSERRYTLAVAYPAAERDAHGDYMTDETLEETAWNYLRKHRKVGLMHKEGTEGAGEVVESYIYRGPPWKLDGEEVKPGDWLIGVIWSPKVWERIKKGEFTGLSIQGWGRKRR